VNFHESGEIVLLRGADHTGELDSLCHVRVVEDTADRTILYTAEGTPLRGRWNLMDRAFDSSVPIALSPRKWRTTDFISITYPGEMYSIWAMWKMPERKFQCWYVNIELPLKRTADGFDTGDLTLDVVVRPDLTWYWKDEEDFAKLTGFGYYSPDLAAEIRQAGLDAIARLESGLEPFNEPWQDWRPDVSWDLPELPMLPEGN
jgi:hypothetical protein